MKALVCVLGLFIACGCAEPSSSAFAAMDSSTGIDNSSVPLEDAVTDSGSVVPNEVKDTDTGSASEVDTGMGSSVEDTGTGSEVVVDTGTGSEVVVDTGTGSEVVVDTGTGEVIDTGTGSEVVDTGTGEVIDTTSLTETVVDTGWDTGVPTDTCWSIDTELNTYVYVCGGPTDTGAATETESVVDTGSVTEVDTGSVTEVDTGSATDTSTTEVIDPDCALNEPVIERFDIDERPAGWEGTWCWGNTSTDPEVNGGYVNFDQGCDGTGRGNITTMTYDMTGCSNVTVAFDYIYNRPSNEHLGVMIVSNAIGEEGTPEYHWEQYHLIPYVPGYTYPLPELPRADSGTVKAYITRENLLPGATSFSISFSSSGPNGTFKFDNVEVRNER
jgi:hypothetical protein